MKTMPTDKHKRIREAHQAANGAGKYSYVMVISSDLGALLTERDALRDALEVIKNWPVTNPLDMDAHNMAAVAQAALAQGQEEA